MTTRSVPVSVAAAIGILAGFAALAAILVGLFDVDFEDIALALGVGSVALLGLVVGSDAGDRRCADDSSGASR